MHSRFFRIALIPTIVLTLGACATTPSVATPDFQAVVDDVADSDSVFGIAMLMADISAIGPISTTDSVVVELDSTALRPAGIVDVGGGLYVGNVVEVADGDTVDVILPTAEEIPAATLSPVEDAFIDATDAADCAVSASPSTASLTDVVLQGFGLQIPGYFVVSFYDGVQLTAASTSPFDWASFPEEGSQLLGWAYADAPFVVDFTGTDCDGLVVESVAFEQGWNVLEWTITNAAASPPTITLDVIAQPATVYLQAEVSTP